VDSLRTHWEITRTHHNWLELTKNSLQAHQNSANSRTMYPGKGKHFPAKKGKGQPERSDLFTRTWPRVHSLISRPPACPPTQTKAKTISQLGCAGALPQPPIQCAQRGRWNGLRPLNYKHDDRGFRKNTPKTPTWKSQNWRYRIQKTTNQDMWSFAYTRQQRYSTNNRLHTYMHARRHIHTYIRMYVRTYIHAYIHNNNHT